MYLGEMGAITFRSIFEKAQKLVGKAKGVTEKAESVVDVAKQYIPTESVLPSEIPPSSAAVLPMSAPPKTNLLMLGGIAVGGFVLMNLLKRR